MALKRELAAGPLPVRDGAIPEHLIGRLGQALQAANASVETARSSSETDLTADPDTADAAHIAGRLRPAIPNE